MATVSIFLIANISFFIKTIFMTPNKIRYIFYIVLYFQVFHYNFLSVLEVISTVVKFQCKVFNSIVCLLNAVGKCGVAGMFRRLVTFTFWHIFWPSFTTITSL